MEGHLVFKWNRFYQIIADLDDRLEEFGLNYKDNGPFRVAAPQALWTPSFRRHWL